MAAVVFVLNCNALFISFCGFIGLNLIEVHDQNGVIVTKSDFLNACVRMCTFFCPCAFSHGRQRAA